MTIEQKIRTFATTYDELFTNKHVYWPNTITVLEDKEGILKIQVENSTINQTSIKYLSKDKYFDTHFEAISFDKR